MAYPEQSVETQFNVINAIDLFWNIIDGVLYFCWGHHGNEPLPLIAFSHLSYPSVIEVQSPTGWERP